MSCLRHVCVGTTTCTANLRMLSEAESTVERLTSSLNETMEEGKRLLLFLGQKP